MLHYNQMLILTRVNRPGKGVRHLDLWKVSIATTSEASDAVSYLLTDLEAHAVEIEDRQDLYSRQKPDFGEIIDEEALGFTSHEAIVHAYVKAQTKDSAEIAPFIDRVNERLIDVTASGLDVGSLAMSVSYVAAESYLHAWRDYYHPLEVGKRLAILPSWEQEAPFSLADRHAIIMEPGIAFGTGTHETTLLCLEALEDRIDPSYDVLDVGTGTGILAIAAAKLGARRVIAVDLDQDAVKVAQENCIVNDVADRVAVYHSDLLGAIDEQQTFHVVTANLLLAILRDLLPDVVHVIKPRGYLIASGIVASQREEAVQLMQANGFTMITTYQKNDWITLLGQSEG